MSRDHSFEWRVDGIFLSLEGVWCITTAVVFLTYAAPFLKHSPAPWRLTTQTLPPLTSLPDDKHRGADPVDTFRTFCRFFIKNKFANTQRFITTTPRLGSVSGLARCTRYKGRQPSATSRHVFFGSEEFVFGRTFEGLFTPETN